MIVHLVCFFFFQAEDGIRDRNVTGVQTCALPIYSLEPPPPPRRTMKFLVLLSVAALACPLAPASASSLLRFSPGPDFGFVPAAASAGDMGFLARAEGGAAPAIARAANVAAALVLVVLILGIFFCGSPERSVAVLKRFTKGRQNPQELEREKSLLRLRKACDAFFDKASEGGKGGGPPSVDVKMLRGLVEGYLGCGNQGDAAVILDLVFATGNVEREKLFEIMKILQGMKDRRDYSSAASPSPVAAAGAAAAALPVAPPAISGGTGAERSEPSR
eukprot:TRINITY_DN22958_c2_g1_i2.p1 TRINITY_DN22958_c2_g1~~TRINITY_DN22958_c2_g1_i2.p1  ORF type:complete len:275 (+),score=48.31 TRINITY_DN22958_c2_g1_i2:17-841(+)